MRYQSRRYSSPHLLCCATFVLDLYPIHLKKDDESYIAMVANLRAKFCREGIVTLPGFLRTTAIPDVIEVRMQHSLIYSFYLN